MLETFNQEASRHGSHRHSFFYMLDLIQLVCMKFWSNLDHSQEFWQHEPNLTKLGPNLDRMVTKW